MKNKFGKLSVVLCLVVTLVLTLVPMFAFSASAEDQTLTYDFSTFSGSSAQYAEETHTLSNDVTLWMKGCHINTQLRIYGAQSGQFAIFKLNSDTQKFTSIAFSAGNKTDTIKIQGSDDGGATWNDMTSIAVTSTSYKDYSASFTTPYQWIKLSIQGTAQVRLKKVTLTYATVGSAGDATCDHANATVETVEATCTTKGYTRTICECGFDETNYTADELGHDWDEGVVTSPAECKVDGVKTYTCQRPECGETKTETIAAPGHSYDENNVCTECGTVKPQIAGTYYIATKRSSGNYLYMTNDLGTASTKRYQAVDTGLTALPASITAPEEKYVFVITENDDGTFYIYSPAADKYLGWTSGNSGALVDKASAKAIDISENENGTYSVGFDDTRWLALNATSGNNYFAWYTGSGQKDLELVPVAEEEPVETAITNAAVNLGSDLSLQFYTQLADGKDIANFKMVFTVNGRDIEATEAAEFNGLYVFTLYGLAPQQMGDRVDAKLYEGDEVVATVEGYSIQKYANYVIADESGAYTAEEKQLVIDMLYYGKAAQDYVDYIVDYEDGTTNEIIPVGTATEEAPEMEAAAPVNTEFATPDAYIAAAGVQFDYVNKLYVKINATDVENVVVKINGVEVELVKNGSLYIVYTDAISATEFGTVFTFELYVDGNLAQTLEYSVNAYANAKWDAANETTKALAQALYRYGYAASKV